MSQRVPFSSAISKRPTVGRKTPMCLCVCVSVCLCPCLSVCVRFWEGSPKKKERNPTTGTYRNVAKKEDPGVYLTNHYQQQPKYPQMPGSTSQTDIQESTTKCSSSIRKPRGLRDQYTGQPQKKNKTKRQPEYPQTPQSASEADIPESPTKD